MKFHLLLIWSLALLLAACLRPAPPASELEAEWRPLAPVDFVAAQGGVISLRAPFSTQDHQYPLVSYQADGEMEYSVYDELLWPTDVFVVADPALLAPQEAPRVFLARSPHGGCLLKWEYAEQWFSDPCYGSRFDATGRYVSGPSPRHLDRLPSEVRAGVIWVRNEIVYGESHQ